jgi:gliding motility-associated-like protein
LVNQPPAGLIGDAIIMYNVHDITIGKAPTAADPTDRGNFFSQNYYSIRHGLDLMPDTVRCYAIRISHNEFGDHAMGTDHPDSASRVGILLKNARDVIIGGTDSIDGNRFYTSEKGVDINMTNLLSIGVDAKRQIIAHNFFNYFAGASGSTGHRAILVQQTSVNANSDTLSVVRNTLRNGDGGIFLRYISKPYTVLGNDFELMPRSHNGFDVSLDLFECAANGDVSMEPVSQKPNRFYNGRIAIYTLRSNPIRMSRNTIYCNRDIAVNFVLPLTLNPPFRITELAADTIKGISCPGCTVEVFQNDTCQPYTFNAQRYVGTSVADAAGNWIFYGDSIFCTTTFTTTDLTGNTSRIFNNKELLINYSNLQIQFESCRKGNGFIKGIKVPKGVSIRWEDEWGNVLGTEPDLIGVTRGKYRAFLKFGTGDCELVTEYFEIENVFPPQFDISSVQLNNPSDCGSSGSIKNIIFNNAFFFYRFKWKDAAGNVVGDTLDLLNVGPGTYTLYGYVYFDTACRGTAGPFTLTLLPKPVMNVANVIIQDDACNASGGSISNITISNIAANPNYQWEDLSGNIVGTGASLLNVRSGRYRLRYKDDAPCDTLFSPWFVINNVGDITLDINNIVIKPSSCDGNDGSITGVIVSGADTYSWINVLNNQNASATINLLNAAPGDYQLIVRNRFGCRAETGVLNISQTVFNSPITADQVNYKHAWCDSATGDIRVLSLKNDNPALFGFSWKDAAGNPLGSGLSLNNIVPGNYDLIAKDTNGCEQAVFTATLLSSTQPVVNTTITLSNDICNTGRGSISNLTITDGTAPFTYTWYNGSNQPIGTQTDLNNLYAGDYYVRIKDRLGCEARSSLYKLGNDPVLIAAPRYDSIIYILRNAKARLVVKNYSPGIYELLNSPNALIPLQTNNSGNFLTGFAGADSIFYIRQQQGSCTSPATRVLVKVVDRSYVVVPTSFTPNNDRINDLLHAISIGPVNLQQFTIYNRWGQPIFFTRDIKQGWDGRYKGAEQPAGAYVWSIEYRDIKGNFFRDRGVITLIR